MKASDVARAMYPDYKEERVARYGAKKSLAVKLKLKSRPTRAAARPQYRCAASISEFAGQVRAERRCGAGRPDRRDRSPGEGITIYPIQSPALKDFRGGAGALARRALGCRRFEPAALSGADPGRQCNEPGVSPRSPP